MSEPGAPEYKVGDVVGGYVLTESGWQPVASGQPTGGYKIGDQANGYVLTETGWQPLPAGQPTQEYAGQPTQQYAGQPTQEYKVGDVAGGYIMTESGWVPVPGAQGGVGAPAPGAGPSGGGPIRPGSSNKVLYWILGGAAALVLLVVIGVVLAVRGSDNAPTTSSNSTPNSASTPRAETRTTTTTTSPSAKTFAFGDTGVVTTRTGKSTGEVKVDAPVAFTSSSRIFTPDKGQFVYVPISATATGTETLSVSAYDFVAILPDGQRVRESIVVELPANAPARLSSSNLNPGEKVIGSVAFDVPANTALKIAYAPSGQILGTWG